MPLPAAIQAQLDQADAIQAHLSAPAAPAATAPVPADSTPAATVSGPTDTPFHDAAAPVPAQAPAAAPAAPQSPDWEQRHRTLQGKYDAEVPRLHGQIRELAGQLKVATDSLDALRQAQATPATPAQPLVTPKDEEVFGSDLIDLIGRRATEIANAQTAALQAQVAALESRLGQTSQRQEVSDDDRFYATLGQLVPDYRDVNTDPRWLAWLGEVDQLTGLTRQKYLDNAAASRDAARTATIFKTFKASLPQVPVAETPAQELQRQVAPSRSSASAAPAADTAATRVWTSKELDTFYKQVRLREIGPKDAERIEAEINRAMAEGRVRL